MPPGSVTVVGTPSGDTMSAWLGAAGFSSAASHLLRRFLGAGSPSRDATVPSAAPTAAPSGAGDAAATSVAAASAATGSAGAPHRLRFLRPEAGSSAAGAALASAAQ